jgi:hypothetical protein
MEHGASVSLDTGWDLYDKLDQTILVYALQGTHHEPQWLGVVNAPYSGCLGSLYSPLGCSMDSRSLCISITVRGVMFQIWLADPFWMRWVALTGQTFVPFTVTA